MRKDKTIPVCPRCGARNSVPIVYGYPGPGMMEASDAGDIELGGCVRIPGQPNMKCRACFHRWHKPLLSEGIWPYLGGTSDADD